MSDLPPRLRVTDVGPRDGLQNEPGVVPAEAKIAYVDAIARAGVAEVEVTSFVSPKWVPQLADAAEVMAGIDRSIDVVRSVLVPNERGLDRALETTPDKVAVFLAASETFSRRNTNGSIDEVLDRTRPVIGRSRSAGLPVRAYVSCVVACPYDGPIEPVAVRSVVERLLEAGADEIDLGETIGVAGPVDLERLLAGLEGCLAPADATLHLHDTRGTALAVALRAMQLGVRSFDASCGGLGGCPYAPGATGNLATEDLVYLADRCGIETGVSLEGLVEASSIMARALGRRPPSRVWRATVAAAGATTETSENH